MEGLILFTHIIGLTLLMMFSFFFSGSETALSALTKIQAQRLRGDKKKSSRAIIRFLDNPRRLFITVVFGNTLVNMAFVSITGSLIYTHLFKGRNTPFAYVAAIALQTFFLLILGEITPKTLAVKHSEKISHLVSRPLWLFSQVIYPFRRALRFLTDILLPVFGIRSGEDRAALTSDEIRAIVKSSEKLGALGEEEGKIIHNIFELHDITAREVMVPRTEMVCIEVSRTIRDAFQKAKSVGHSRLPVYRDSIDNVCGIFNVKDLPRWKGLRIKELEGRDVESLTIEEFMANARILNDLNPEHKNTLIRSPFFTVKSKKIGLLMRELTKEKQQMAILLGEYGGVMGLVTVEDIVEEVIGEIFDEYDTVSELTIQKDPEDPLSRTIPGFVSLRSINRGLNLRLDVSRADTIGGYAVSLFGAIPQTGDVVTDTANGLEFKILKMDGPRVTLLRLLLPSAKPKKKNRVFKRHFLFLLVLTLPLLGASNTSQTPAEAGFPVLLFSAMLILSLTLLAFYAGAETAVVSASKAKIDVLASKENKRALLIKKMWQEPDKLLGIVLVGSSLIFSAAGLAGLRLTHFFLQGREGLEEFVNTVCMTLLILIFCEILPKTIFRARADALALRSASMLWVSSFLLNPVVSFVTKITNLIVRIVGDEEVSEKQRIMREELKLLAEMGKREGVLRNEQFQMIHSVLDLETVTLEKVMTPLVDMVAIPKDMPVENYYKIVSESGYSRIPVYEHRVDNIIGLVNILDVLFAETPAPTITPFVRRDVRHEPESKRIYSLLREPKHGQSHMVFVVDEYGGVVGLVTIEDLVEEILGEIQDEKDIGFDELIHKISDKIIECEGKTEIQLINQVADVGIPSGDYITVAGYLIHILERIPRAGEFVETKTFKIVVLEADSRSVRKVRIVLND